MQPLSESPTSYTSMPPNKKVTDETRTVKCKESSVQRLLPPTALIYSWCFNLCQLPLELRSFHKKYQIQRQLTQDLGKKQMVKYFAPPCPQKRAWILCLAGSMALVQLTCCFCVSVATASHQSRKNSCSTAINLRCFPFISSSTTVV